LHREPLLVAILGPTGSGKTALSLRIAEAFHGEIVNCDSVAIHRDFVIGTAKPTPEEQARAPHHLLDEVDPRGYTTAGEYARKAPEDCRRLRAGSSFAMLVGDSPCLVLALIRLRCRRAFGGRSLNFSKVA